MSWYLQISTGGDIAERTKRRSEKRHRLEPRVITKEGLLDDVRASEAVRRLVKWGVDEEVLLPRVLKIPLLSDEVQPLVSGMTERTVMALPNRIKEVADEIRRVNLSPVLNPDHLLTWSRTLARPHKLPMPLNLTATVKWAEATVVNFEKLPTVLEFYGLHLQAWLQFFHPKGQARRNLGLGRGIRLRTWFTLELLSFVRHSTGKPRYSEVATLLEVAYGLSGRPKVIDVDSLSKLEKNNRWTAFVIGNARWKP